MALYTTCPGCRKQFQLRAAHLAAASGEVRCGYCKRKFNALACLDDVPDIPALPAKSTKSGAMPRGAPQRPPADKKGRKKPAGSARAAGMDAVVHAYESQLESIDKQERKVAAYRPFWLAGVVVFSLLLAIQSMWHYRNRMYVNYPELLPQVQWLCQKLPCEAMRQLGLNNIELINRDVRFHPQYSDTLLVNATIVNRADVYMPLPLIEIQVYDLDGEALGWRRFRPDEYVEGDGHLHGMPPDEPVYVILELVGGVVTAEGFEIGFAYPQHLLFFAR